MSKSPIPQELRPLLDEWDVRVAGHREIDYGTQYYLERGRESARLNVFTTGKVTVQGPSSGLKDLLAGRLAQREAKGASRVRSGARPVLDATPRVGIDEAGKGDYFGPLVVAGVRVTGERVAQELQRSDVRDSKKLGATAARGIAERILEVLGVDNVSVVTLSPPEYEARRKAAGNVNRLLDELDAEIIAQLKDNVELVVVDQYAVSARERLEPFVPEGVKLEVRKRAEDDAAVAAASILARARFLEELEGLSRWAGFELPKGATHVFDAGRRVFRERGRAGLERVAKTSFRTTEQIVGGTF